MWRLASRILQDGSEGISEADARLRLRTAGQLTTCGLKPQQVTCERSETRLRSPVSFEWHDLVPGGDPAMPDRLSTEPVFAAGERKSASFRGFVARLSA